MPQKLVSVGMAVLNEERRLAQALDSVLSQDYQNIEVIICDNLSTDKTADIAKEYAKRDSRIKYFLNTERVSSFKNYSLTFKLSSGEYFMFFGGHDLMEKNYVSSCAEILDKETSVVLAYSFYDYIDSDGRKVNGASYIYNHNTRHMNVWLRIYHLFFPLPSPCMFSGITRSYVIRKTYCMKKFKDVWSDDAIFFMQLSLFGEFAHIPKILFYFRINRSKEEFLEPTLRHIKDIYREQHCNYLLPIYAFHMFYIYWLTIFDTPMLWYYKPPVFLWILINVSSLYIVILIKILFKKCLKN